LGSRSGTITDCEVEGCTSGDVYNPCQGSSICLRERKESCVVGRGTGMDAHEVGGCTTSPSQLDGLTNDDIRGSIYHKTLSEDASNEGYESGESGKEDVHRWRREDG